MKPSYFLPALAIVLAAWIVSDAYRDARQAGEGIVVKGTAERQLKSDRIIWRGTVSAHDMNRQDALKALDADMSRVNAWLLEQNMDKGDWSWGTLENRSHNLRDEHGNWTEEVGSWTLEKQLVLASHDVPAITALAEAADELIRMGIDWRSRTPEYYVSRLEQVKLELIEEATRNARDRAERFVGGGGGRLGLLKAARQGVFQVTAPLSTEMEGYGMYNTDTIEKTVKAVVTAEFNLRK